jgi:hypothetical protein
MNPEGGSLGEPEFRRQMVELVRAALTPEELATLARTGSAPGLGRTAPWRQTPLAINSCASRG